MTASSARTLLPRRRAWGSLPGLGEPFMPWGLDPIPWGTGSSGLDAGGAALAGCDVIGPDSSGIQGHDSHIAVESHPRGEILNPRIVKVLLRGYQAILRLQKLVG